MRVWIPLSERRRLKELRARGIRGRVRCLRPALIAPRLRSRVGTGLSNRTVDEYYELLCERAMAVKRAHGNKEKWWQTKKLPQNE